MKLAPFILVSLLAVAAQAQTVYRCGNTYSQQPCEGAAVVKADDARTPAQAATANADTQRAQKAADAMEKARLQQEARAPQANILAPEKKEAVKEPKADERDPKKHARKQGKKPQYFTAVAPKPPKPTKAPKKKSAA